MLSVERYLRADEESIVTARQHPALLIQPFMIAAGGAAAAAAVSVIPAAGRPAKILAWALVTFLVFRLFFLAVNYLVRAIGITSTRILLVSGFFTITVTSIDLKDLRYCTFEQTFGGRLLGYGAIVLESGKQSKTLIDYLPYPHDIYLLVNSGKLSRDFMDFTRNKKLH
jgi:uncharacterized membrane protein YjfL (UPF0719 family)